MKKIVLIILVLFSSITTAQAFYTIDGDVSDWGINLNLAVHKNYLDNNLPTGGKDMDYVTEDNVDKFSGTVWVGPGYSTKNTYDAESLYFDNDSTYAYIALITGLPQTEVTYPAGDIFIEVGGAVDPFGINYTPTVNSFAIDIKSSTLYSVASIEKVKYIQHSESNPWRLKRDPLDLNEVDSSNALIRPIDFVYSTDEEKTSHYVMEARILLTDLGLDLSDMNDETIWLHWTMKCGNDYLNLKADINAVPEPASLILFATGLFNLYFFRRKK